MAAKLLWVTILGIVLLLTPENAVKTIFGSNAWSWIAGYVLQQIPKVQFFVNVLLFKNTILFLREFVNEYGWNK